jgi:CRP-like cAMP-binding protein
MLTAGLLTCGSSLVPCCRRCCRLTALPALATACGTTARVMTKADVRRLLLGDPSIAARISETLGRRLGELEQRLGDTVFKSVPERIAGALVTLASARSGRPLGRGVQIRLTHE